MRYKLKTIIYAVILVGTTLNAWEVNTHRAIDRCALSAECGGQRSLNLQQFNFILTMARNNEMTILVNPNILLRT